MSIYWTAVGVESSVPWPLEEKTVEFDGHQLVLKPESATLSPSISFEHGTKGIPYEEAMTIIRRFMSALAWVDAGKIRETFTVGGPRPPLVGKSPNCSVGSTHFDPHYLPNPSDKKQRLALALYRDAQSINSVPYKFLGFARIINIIAKSGLNHKAWINSNFHLVKDPDGLKVISTLKLKGIDIGDHIFVSGRCANAHANEDPIVDPDSSTDLARMNEELPLIRSLAEIVIEKELGIKSKQTIWKEHLYELAGFRKKLPSTLIDEITKGGMRTVKPEEVGFSISLGLRQKEPYIGLTNLDVESAEMGNGVLFLWLASKEKCVKFAIGLDLVNEKLKYNPYDGFQLFDDGSLDAIKSAQGFLKFRKDLFLNGKIQLETSDKKQVLGYTDAFLPENIEIQGTIRNFDAAIAALEAEIQKRSPK